MSRTGRSQLLADHREQQADDQSHADADDDREHEVSADRPRIHDADDGCDARVQCHQRGRVVEQALALEHGHEPSGKAGATGDGLHGDRVRRCDHGAEGEGRGQGDRGHHEEGREPDDDHGERHESDREQQDAVAPGSHIDDRRLDGRGEQQRREQAEEHHLRLQRDLGHPGNEGRGCSDEDEHDGSRPAHPAGQASDRDRDDDERHDPDDCGDRIHDVHDGGNAGGAPRFPTNGGKAVRPRRCGRFRPSGRVGRAGGGVAPLADHELLAARRVGAVAHPAGGRAARRCSDPGRRRGR